MRKQKVIKKRVGYYYYYYYCFFPLDCIGLVYGAVTWWTNDLEKPENSKGELIDSLSGSYYISHVMNERLEKPEDSTGELIPVHNL